ncbi:MAG TPA: glycosyl transferase, partial [Porphyromonadaceae bacterium]|nr:glycosyl transferase [Porphyromonadaceae bacterium]
MIGLVVIVIQMLFFTIVLINYFFAPVLSLPKQALKASNKSVAVLIPVRNEEEHIKDLLDDLFAQSRLPEEIIIYNDGSVDNTKLIVESYIENYPHIIRMIEGGELPKGWLGKAHACYHLGNAANADYLLFLDADVRLHACAVASILDQMVKYKWTLLSAFPKQIMKTWGEKIVVPIMNIVLLSLLPLPLIRIKRFSSLSAANGQMMCFDRSVYIANQFHVLVKQEKAEDIAIART